MLHLASEAERLARVLAFGNSVRWAKAVVSVRNHFAHLSRLGFITEELLDRSVGVVYSLRWVCVALLLADNGCDPDVLRSCLERHSQYVTFLGNAREWLPTVYDGSNSL